MVQTKLLLDLTKFLNILRKKFFSFIYWFITLSNVKQIQILIKVYVKAS